MDPLILGPWSILITQLNLSPDLSGYFALVINSCRPTACEYFGFLILSQPAIAFVDAMLSLRHNSFQIVVTRLFKQQLALSFDVLGVDDSPGRAHKNFTSSLGYLGPSRTKLKIPV